MEKILGLSLDDLYLNLKFGKSKRKISSAELRSKLNNFIKSPVFFLSTGRCGTQWMSQLLEYHKDLLVLHSPKPALDIQSKLVYEIIIQNKTCEDEKNLIKEIFLTAREQALRYSYKTKKRYIETNNYITFFAPFLAEIFPDAKFVHLYRHPGEFVRSGIRRQYFTEGNPNDVKRIIPYENKDWDSFSRIEKTAWLWNETNLFIENFKENLPEKVFNFNFNELNLSNVKDLLSFLNIEISEEKINKLFDKKINVQKSGDFDSYKDWDDSQKNQLREICKDLASKYQYNI